MSASPVGGPESPASGWYNSGQVVQVSATPNSGYPFTGFSGGLTGTPNPQGVTMNGPVGVLAIFGSAMTHSVVSTPSAPSFSVDGTACARGVCTFAPQPGGDTLTATPTGAPTGRPAPIYHFSTTDNSIAAQEIPAPIIDQGGGNGCPWGSNGGGKYSGPTPTSGPQPAPVIDSVTLDQAGQIPAAAPVASKLFPYSVAVSCGGTLSAPALDTTFVGNGDNTASGGTINLTYNLLPLGQ
jgi:hypothetical protein